ncbi:MAG: hypothetical protein GX815_09735 [Clostridiales bacterium]|jgi:hypothetical protein|nr:hypothetical protein [Clostridiales bacterium]
MEVVNYPFNAMPTKVTFREYCKNIRAYRTGMLVFILNTCTIWDEPQFAAIKAACCGIFYALFNR